MASDTTKKVATNTFDASNYDINQVALDFMDELQTSILQVRLNLNKEYERRKLEHAKSLAGQQEDIDRLNKVSQEQDKEMMGTLETMSEDGAKWKDEHLKSLQHLVDVFNQVEPQGETKYLQYIQNTLTRDKNLQTLAKKTKFDLTKIIKEISGVVQGKQHSSTTQRKTEEDIIVSVVKGEKPKEPTSSKLNQPKEQPTRDNKPQKTSEPKVDGLENKKKQPIAQKEPAKPNLQKEPAIGPKSAPNAQGTKITPQSKGMALPVPSVAEKRETPGSNIMNKVPHKLENPLNKP